MVGIEGESGYQLGCISGGLFRAFDVRSPAACAGSTLAYRYEYLSFHGPHWLLLPDGR